jgi:membrane protein
MPFHQTTPHHVQKVISDERLFRRVGKAIHASTKKFIADNAIKLSASLSYYTIFAMPPMLVIIFSFSGLFFGKEAIQGEVYGQISGIVGSTVAIQIQDIIKNVHLSRDTHFATVVSIITLLIGSTGLFAEIQDSINLIWGIRAKPKKGWLKVILNRLLSFSLIISIGFLLLVSLAISTGMDLLSNHLQQIFTHITVKVFYVLNLIIVFSVITTMFTIIFKVLPDGKVNWRDALMGASLTTIFFMLGKFLISFYLSHSTVSTVYGAAGSVVVILLWIYFSSIILYFGAEFTMVYACMYGRKIIPNSYAVFVEVKEIEHRKPHMAIPKVE